MALGSSKAIDGTRIPRDSKKGPIETLEIPRDSNPGTTGALGIPSDCQEGRLGAWRFSKQEFSKQTLGFPKRDFKKAVMENPGTPKGPLGTGFPVNRDPRDHHWLCQPLVVRSKALLLVDSFLQHLQPLHYLLCG